MLDKNDIAAMRAADYAVFFYSPTLSQGCEWGVRLGQRDKPDATWTHGYTTATRTVEADPVNCTLRTFARDRETFVSALATMSIYDFEASTQVLRQLRAGDELGIVFTADDNNQHVTDAGLHHDRCHVRIIRKGKVVGEFQVADTVGPNNTARICRTQGTDSTTR